MGRPVPIDTLLFDLDGTLVDQFQPGSELQFTWLILRRFGGIAWPTRTYRAAKAAVHALQHHRSELTNFEAMVQAFCGELAMDPQEARDRVMTLARDDFRSMGWRFHGIPGAREVVDQAQRLGFRRVLATNPTVPWPMTEHRLAWGGFGDVAWDFATHPQIMTRTKPDVGYYHELLAKLGCGPERCLMVGNDFRKDLPAMQAGIQTFLLDRPMSKKARRALESYRPDHFGSYADLGQLLEKLAAER